MWREKVNILFMSLLVKELLEVHSLTIKANNVKLDSVSIAKEKFMMCDKKVPEGKQKSFECAESLNGTGDINAYEKIVSTKNITFNNVGVLNFKSDINMEVDQNLDVRSAAEVGTQFILSGKSVVKVGNDLTVQGSKMEMKIEEEARLVVSGSAEIGTWSSGNSRLIVNSHAQFDRGLRVYTEYNASLVIGKGAKLFIKASSSPGAEVVGTNASLTMGDEQSYISVKNGSLLLSATSNHGKIVLGSCCVEKNFTIVSDHDGKLSLEDVNILPGARITVGRFVFQDHKGNVKKVKVPEQIKVKKGVVCDEAPKKGTGKSSGDVEIESSGILHSSQYLFIITCLIVGLL